MMKQASDFRSSDARSAVTETALISLRLFLFWRCMMGKLIDLTGKRFGRLVVAKRKPNTKHQKAQWLCLCDCGEYAVVIGSKLINGHTKSCGCILKELLSKKSTIHGLSGHPLYTVWSLMRQRCFNPGSSGFKNYGGRGITICSQWDSFKSFYCWAKTSGYKKELTLDRKDNNKGYSPENCRWATRSQQANNKRTNRNLSFYGAEFTMAEWGRILGFSQNLIGSRLKGGWSVSKALTTPTRKIKKTIKESHA